MPDNITTLLGPTLASDEIAGVQYPRAKLGFGADGEYVDVSPSAPVPVEIFGGGGDATAANQTTMIAALTSLLAKIIATPATEAKQDAAIAIGTERYVLASESAPITIAAGAAGPSVTVARGGYFFFDAVFTGSSPSLKLQRRAADGTTWIDVVTRTVIGSGDPVGIPNGSVLRVFNSGAGALTSVSAVLG